MTFTSVQHSVRAPSVGRFRARGAASFRVPATSTYRNRVIANATLEKGSKLTDFPNFYKVRCARSLPDSCINFSCGKAEPRHVVHRVVHRA
jgi:hypothetical protein